MKLRAFQHKTNESNGNAPVSGVFGIKGSVLSRKKESAVSRKKKEDPSKKAVLDTGIIPDALFSDAFFQKYPPDFNRLAMILSKSGVIVRKMLGSEVKPWQIAALLGMEGSLNATFGHEFEDLVDAQGFTVLHYYVVSGQREVVISHLTRYKPNFRARTDKDYSLAEVAAAAGAVDMLAIFSKMYGFDLGRLNGKQQTTLVHTAIEFDQEGIVHWLIQNTKFDPRKGRNFVRFCEEHGRLELRDYFEKLEQIPTISPTLTGLRADLHAAKIAPYLSNKDLCALQRSSQALRFLYQSEQIWTHRLRQLQILPECLFDHPDFGLFTYNYRQLVGILVAGGKAMRDLFRDAGEPWQLAALLGEEEQLRRVYNCPRNPSNKKDDVAKRMQEKLVYFADDWANGIREYMIFGNQKEKVISWMEYYKPGYKAVDDPEMRQLTAAVKVGAIPTFACLVRHYGYDINALHPKDESSLLYTSVLYGRIKMTKLLIGLGLSQDVGIKLGKGYSFTLVASGNGHWELFNYLRALDTQRGVEQDEDGMRAIMSLALKHGNRAVYDEMDAKPYVRICYRTDGGKAGNFLSTVDGGRTEMVLLALDEKTGWGSLEHDFGNGTTILHQAALEGHAQLIADLVEKFPGKLNPRAITDAGNTIIHLSSVHGCYRTTMRLYNDHFAAYDEKNGNKNKGGKALLQPNKVGRTVVHFAAANGKLNFLHLLRKDFGDKPLKAVDNYGNTALHDACTVGACKVVPWLINTVGLSPRELNKNGESPLHVLVKRAIASKLSWGRVDSTLFQIDFSYITDNKNKSGETVKDLLIQGKQHDMLQELQENAARIKQLGDPNLSDLQVKKH